MNKWLLHRLFSMQFFFFLHNVSLFTQDMKEGITMCTAVTYQTKDFYFGRTLDHDFSYHEQVVITPKNYPFHFRKEKSLKTHYAMIGMAYVVEEYPLYYDACNEKGLCMAGLNFVGNAVYFKPMKNKINLANFELIPYILGTCSSVKEVKELFEKMNMIDMPFSHDLPCAELHYLISDANESITVESIESGIHIYQNHVGVLTNNPPFGIQMFHLNMFLNLSSQEPYNKFSDKIELDKFSRGMGAIGLPGDVSSTSRFVRACFVKLNSVSSCEETESVSQFFHILNSVDQQRGCCRLEEDKYEITIYTSCINATKGIYYYTTYDNHQITAINMFAEDLNQSQLITFPLRKKEQIYLEN